MSGGEHRQGLGLVPGVPAKLFTMCMNDWEPGVTTAKDGSAAPDCPWVARDKSGRPNGVSMPSVEAGRVATLTWPTNTAESSVTTCSVDVALLVTANTGT